MAYNNFDKNNNKTNKVNNSNYVGAPYNFIALNNKVIKSYDGESTLPAHNQIIKDRLSGEIQYTISAASPIFISDGKGKNSSFFKNANDKYAVPGSTVRGLTRNNVQILGMGALGEDIDDNTLMFRTVGASRSDLKDRYNNILGVKPVQIKTKEGNKGISVAKNVKAGYITKKNEKYYLYGTKVDSINSDFGKMNYYPFRKAEVLYSVLPSDVKKPFYEKINYEIKGERNIIAVSRYNKCNPNKEGYLVRSGFMNGKKALYIIPEIDESNITNIAGKDILAFKHDYELKENQLGNNYKYYSLPDEGEIKPVFYIENGGNLYFGYTPYLRLFYDYSIHDGIPSVHKDMLLLDYARSMFGYSNENNSYKSRVYFEDAELSNNKQLLESQNIILGTPKPSSYLDYLRQGKDLNINTYNTNGFLIRGIKQYWFKNNIQKPNNIKNMNVAASIKPIDVGAEFKGIIRFKNLSEIELGLLLWSIKLESNCSQNIGMAKSYGYGKINIKINALNINDYDKMYSFDDLYLRPFNDGTEQIDVFIQKYKSMLQNQFGKQVLEIPTIRDFITMKSITPDDKLTRYMSIDAKEYQNRKTPLQEVNYFNKAIKENVENKNAHVEKEKLNQKDEVKQNGEVSLDELLKLQNQYSKDNKNNKKDKNSKFRR